jgi:hypothetical protein
MLGRGKADIEQWVKSQTMANTHSFNGMHWGGQRAERDEKLEPVKHVTKRC